MKNEITRKITSLTLLTILLAGAVTFAVPGAMPAAEAAHNANLFVSGESSIFKNTFGGPMVIEVVINDPLISDTDEAKGEPDVTVNGKDLRMVQATDGLWYGYIADRTQAQLADQLVVGLTPGVGLDFGTFCDNDSVGASIVGGGTIPAPIFSDTVGVAIDSAVAGGAQGTALIEGSGACALGAPIPSFVNVVREPKTPNTSAPSLNVGQINIDADAWPFIQLYDFNPTGNVEVKYNKGGGTQTTTLTFDTMDIYSKISLDKSTYTVGSEVHSVITDGQLGIDPTDEDVWTFGTDPLTFETHYQVFDENGASTPASLTSPNIVTALSSLMFEDNGVVKLVGNTQGGGTSVVDLDANNDQTAPGFVDGTLFTSAVGAFDDDGDGLFDEDPTELAIDNDFDGFFDEDRADGLVGVNDDGDGGTDEDGKDVIDNDLDTFFDEDPVDGIDNDGDFAINGLDEDPIDGIDFDGDFLIDEDGIDTLVNDDGDGLTDEDPSEQIDNDADGLLNEDGPGQDNDGDGLWSEDPLDGIDNDGDGLTDEDTAEPITRPMTFVETGANTGSLTNYDENDDSNLDICSATNDCGADAARGTSGAIDYNKKSTSIVVGFGFGTLAFGTPTNGEWNSGEEIPVTLVDADANRNSRADEDLDVNNPLTALVPALRIGTPLTLFNSAPSATLGGVFPTGFSEAVQSFSDRGLFVLLGTETIDNADTLTITMGTMQNLFDVAPIDTSPTTGVAPFYRGFALLNYDVRSLANTGNAVGISTVNIAVNGQPIASNQPLIGKLILNNGPFDGLPLGNDTPTDSLDVVFTINTSAVGETIAAGTTLPLVVDFFGFGLIGDGLKTEDRINNSIYRFEVEETGDNTSTFLGTAEYTMLNQLNIFDTTTYLALRPIDDEVTFIVHEDLDDEDAPRVSYLDLGSDGTSVQISAQQDAATHSGVVSFDKDAYKVGDTVTIQLADADLNVDSDLIDVFVSFFGADPASDTVGEAGLPLYTDGTAFGRLMDVTFDDNRWQTLPCGVTSLDTGLADAGFTLVETGTDTGVFKGDFAVPADYCPPTGPAESVTGLDLEVNYVDFRDASGETIEVGDGAGIRANTGSVSFDRTVYPVPFGKVADFNPNTDTTPDGRSLFPVHLTGIDQANSGCDTGAGLQACETLGDGFVTTHIRVNDPDFDVSASGEDKIQQNNVDRPTGPVKITVSRGSAEVTLAYAGGPTSVAGVIDVGDNGITKEVGPGGPQGFYNDDPAVANVDVGGNGIPEVNSAFDVLIRQTGPITEIAPNAGIFEVDFDIRYTDGPADTGCPVTNFFVNTDGAGTSVTDRFDTAPLVAQNNYCILQGDILTVEYTDPTDSSGDPNSITDSATFDLRNGVLQSDKSVYIIGSDMIMTLIEPDLDLDSDSAESFDLDLIEWDSDADTTTMGDLGGSNAALFDPEPSDFRETGDNTGIFQIVIEIPNTLGGERLDRGEEIELEYSDWGPSGADFVGDEEEDINLTIYTSNFGATVELDQKVYTWTDKIFITIVAPDHNFDSNLVDDIGNNQLDKIVVASRGEKLSQYKLTETGTDTGIFTGEVILTGFRHDADGDPTTGIGGNDIDIPQKSSCPPCGPTDGFLPADDDDGLTVSFEFTEDETVVGSSLVRWNIGETQFLEASYPATGQGVLRIVDPDMNLNPEAVDNFNADVWSDSDAGGIDLTVTETNEATGIFEGIVHFTVTDESSGHRLRVAEGDTVTGEYEDNTLPSPYTTADELEIAATTFIGSIVPPLERAPASNPRIVDAFGNELDEVNVDQQVQITADLANGQDRDQPFAYLVQIQDEDGVTVALSWITGSLAPGQTLNPAQSWTPTSQGTYNVQLFVWESVDNPDALSPPVSTEIAVV